MSLAEIGEKKPVLSKGACFFGELRTYCTLGQPDFWGDLDKLNDGVCVENRPNNLPGLLHTLSLTFEENFVGHKSQNHTLKNTFTFTLFKYLITSNRRYPLG